MPPYRKAVSKKQQRKFFVLAKEGKMSESDAEHKARRGIGYKKMPMRKKKKGK